MTVAEIICYVLRAQHSVDLPTILDQPNFRKSKLFHFRLKSSLLNNVMVTNEHIRFTASSLSSTQFRAQVLNDRKYSLVTVTRFKRVVELVMLMKALKASTLFWGEWIYCFSTQFSLCLFDISFFFGLNVELQRKVVGEWLQGLEEEEKMWYGTQAVRCTIILNSGPKWIRQKPWLDDNLIPTQWHNQNVFDY